MNCHEFTKIVDELASAHLSEDALRGKGMEHAAMCARCAARFEVVRALSTGLQTLASEERRIEAPPFLKRELMDAFASHQPRAAQTVLSFPRRTHWSRWALAAAATLILGFTLFASRLIRTPAPTETAFNVIPATTLTTREVTLENISKKPTVKTTNTTSTPYVARHMRASKSQANALAFVPRAARKIERRVNPVKTENAPAETASTDVASNEVASTEIKTGFVPLTYLNSATAMESGIVVRVEVAREKLAALGLPLNLERAGETIKADIVLGDDGVARAIRLVQ